MLLGTELVEEFVATVILTGRVASAAPVSAVLIASPECGKTSIVMSRPCKSTFFLSDTTGKGLMELCKMRAEMSHFIINDLVAIMSHRQTVNQYTQAIINAMTEEGIVAVAFPGMVETFPSGKRAIIACTTIDLFRDCRHWWHKIGLSTRMVPFAFDHDKELEIKIKSLIMNGNPPSSKKELLVPPQPVPVQMEEKYKTMVRKISDFRSGILEDSKGYRRLHQFLTLTKAHALYRSFKKPTVNQHDIEFLQRIDKYCSYKEVVPL
jgi:hypothetical protein